MTGKNNGSRTCQTRQKFRSIWGDTDTGATEEDTTNGNDGNGNSLNESATEDSVIDRRIVETRPSSNQQFGRVSSMDSSGWLTHALGYVHWSEAKLALAEERKMCKCVSKLARRANKPFPIVVAHYCGLVCCSVAYCTLALCYMHLIILTTMATRSNFCFASSHDICH